MKAEMKVPNTTTLTLGDKQFEVAVMNDTIKDHVRLMDEWRQDEQDQTNELLKTRSAIAYVQQTIANLITQQIENAANEQEKQDAE